MQQHSASPEGSTSWQTSDVARRAGLGLALHRVEPPLAVVSERLWVSGLVLRRRGKSDHRRLDKLRPGVFLSSFWHVTRPGSHQVCSARQVGLFAALYCAHPPTAQP